MSLPSLGDVWSSTGGSTRAVFPLLAGSRPAVEASAIWETAEMLEEDITLFKI